MVGGASGQGAARNPSLGNSLASHWHLGHLLVSGHLKHDLRQGPSCTPASASVAPHWCPCVLVPHGRPPGKIRAVLPTLSPLPPLLSGRASWQLFQKAREGCPCRKAKVSPSHQTVASPEALTCPIISSGVQAFGGGRGGAGEGLLGRS